MPRTPDRVPGASDEEATIYESTVVATVPGEQRYDGARFSLRDSVGEFDPVAVRATVADTTAGYLNSKIVVSGDLNKTLLNPGANESLELGVEVGTVFSVSTEEQQALKSTTLTTPQDAFSGVSLSPGIDGDYLIFFEGVTRVTNNNGSMEIAVGLNGINAQAGSERPFTGNSSGSTIAIFRINGLTTGDTIHGVYRKLDGSGTATISNRSLTIMRVG